jgi:hypothetical protein
MMRSCFLPVLLLSAGIACGYEWTTDHMQVGVRWQPFAGRPANNACDATRPVIAEDSSYAQFWVSWAAMEPQEINTDYANHMSGSLQTIEAAVDACVAEGLKVELVFWHCPAWASESGKAGPWKPKKDQYSAFAARIAKHFKGRVDAYQLYHEANIEDMMKDGDADLLISEMFTKGAQAIRRVYEASPAAPVLISTAGISPNEAGAALGGLEGEGAAAANNLYDRMIADAEMMKGVDALNLNVSDHFDGYGCMDGAIISSVWGNYDLVRGKLDDAGYRNKSVQASESWIVWDDAPNAADVNSDGLKNELDAYCKTITIMGRCLERGLNTFNLPWSDNSSGWAMGLTKRRDYNGRIKTLDPSIVIPASGGGADVVTRKVTLRGGDEDFTVEDGELGIFTIEDYINPPDPNHLHYYIWKWFAQIAGGSDEVIRHAMAGELGNDIKVWGIAYTGPERYKLSSYNRTKEKFTVLLYADQANGKWAKVSIPSTIQTGRRFNNEFSKTDFRGEGFADGETYTARIVSKDISLEDGSDVGLTVMQSKAQTVTNGTLTCTLGGMRNFTAIEFIKGLPQ